MTYETIAGRGVLHPVQRQRWIYYKGGRSRLVCCRSERVVDDVAPDAILVASRYVGGSAPDVDVLTIGRGARDRPVHDQQGNVIGGVDMAGPDLDGKPKRGHACVCFATVGSGGGRAGTADENANLFVDALDGLGVAGVERGREHMWLLLRARCQRETAAGWENVVSHSSMETGDLVAHQAVSSRWDEELVPTPSGRTHAPSATCPVEVSLAAITGRWTTLVLRNLMSGDSYSYTELAESLPQLSDKVLTERLRELVIAGFVERRIAGGFPRRTEYRITERGRELRPLLVELYRTGLALQSHDRAGDA